MVTTGSAIIWVIIPAANFFIWLKIARDSAPHLPCTKQAFPVISQFLRSDLTTQRKYYVTYKSEVEETSHDEYQNPSLQ